MRSLALALVLAIAWLPRADGFAPLSSPLYRLRQQHVVVPGLRPSRSGRPALSLRPSRLAFKVSDVDEDVDEDTEQLQFEDPDQGSGLLRKLSRGVVPLAASLGFVVTPSSAVAVRMAGAAVGGLAGLAARGIMLRSMRKAAPDPTDGDDNDGGNPDGPDSARVAAALRALSRSGAPPLATLDLKGVEAVAKKAQVPAKELAELFTFAFAEVVLQAVRQEGGDLTDLSCVMDFAAATQLSLPEMADGFTIAAIQLGKSLDLDERGFLLPSYPEGTLEQAAKVFFLADKMLGTSEGYYGKRLEVGLSFFTEDDFQEVITQACRDLYTACIQSVVASPASFTAQEVQQLKEFISVSARVSALRPAAMEAMLADSLRSTLDRSLIVDAPLDGAAESEEQAGALPAHMTVSIANYSKLQEAQAVLGWDSAEFDRNVETKTLPLFDAAVKDIVEQAVEQPDRVEDLTEVLRQRIEALRIDPAKACVALTTAVSDKNAQYMERIDKVYNASGGAIEPAFKIMSQYATSHAALQTLSAPFLEGASIPLPGLPFADMVRVDMFKMQLQRPSKAASAGGGGDISDDMFSLSPEQQAVVRRHLALPKITTWVAQCLREGNLADQARAAYEKLLQEYDIQPASGDWQATALDFYYKEVQLVAAARQVPTQSDSDRLASTRGFLSLSQEGAERVNLELLGDKYVKAVSEAMTPAGECVCVYIYMLYVC